MTGEILVPRSHRARLMRLTSNNGPVICLPDIKQNHKMLNGMPRNVRQTIMRCLVSFNFDNVRISPEEVHFYLKAAETIPGLDRITQICEENLIQYLAAQNAVYTLHVGRRFGLTSVVKETITFIAVHLSTIMQQEEFSTLNEQDVREIQDLHHRTFGNETMDREPNTKSVQKERKVYVTFTTDSNSKLEAIVRDGCTSKQYHTETISENGKKKKLRPNFAMCSIQEDENDPPVILFTGGSGEKSNEVLLCDVINNKWKTRKHMKYGREHHALCVVNSQVYAMGGYCQSGGENKMVPQIEIYNTCQNTWKEAASLPIPVHSCTCVTAGNRIFIIGGMDENGKEVNAIQIFDTIKDKFTKRCALPENCSKAKAIHIDNSIFLVTESGKLLRIDIRTLEMQYMSTHPEVSTHFSIHEWENGFMATYHSKEKENKLISYVYNVQDNTWTFYDRFHMRLDKTSMCGNCTIRYPSNICHIPFCD
ncbi:hypothetical protein FSP39_001503 [Pinctada imbricata]|uniref:Uncharacterized protein n=1 Tax=Pinctada imbricata TaxID=66713 RepID=A0AA89C2A1_PINIB|nr:hypothetical protein FSP39_001503 [Pinctada imbricata]